MFCHLIPPPCSLTSLPSMIITVVLKSCRSSVEIICVLSVSMPPAATLPTLPSVLEADSELGLAVPRGRALESLKVLESGAVFENRDGELGSDPSLL